MKKFSPEHARAIMELIQQRREEIIRDTATLLSFKTISSRDGIDSETRIEFKKAFDFIEELSRRLGFDFRMLEDKVGIVEVTAPEKNSETIGVLLHIDVMPPGKSQWRYPPFGGKVEEGKIWGRGAQDDKGPIIASMYGLWAACEIEGRDKLARSCRLIIGTQEETGDWGDIHFYKQKEGAPAFCVVPDAEFPVINAEKGMINAELSLEWDDDARSDTIESSLESLISGERANMVPDLATLVLKPLKESAAQKIEEHVKSFQEKHEQAELQVENQNGDIIIQFKGSTAHGSRPFEGHNAALDALQFLLFVDVVPPELSRFIEFVKSAGESIWGDRLGIKSEHYFVGKTTSALGMLGFDKGKASVIFNIRNTLGMSVNSVEEKILSVIETFKDSTGVEIQYQRKSAGTEPLFVDPQKFKHFIDPLQFAYETVTGKESELKAIGGTTFAKAFPSAVSFGPVLLDEEAEMAHQVNEHVAVDHQIRNTQIYGIAIWGLIGSA